MEGSGEGRALADCTKRGSERDTYTTVGTMFSWGATDTSGIGVAGSFKPAAWGSGMGELWGGA